MRASSIETLIDNAIQGIPSGTAENTNGQTDDKVGISDAEVDVIVAASRAADDYGMISPLQKALAEPRAKLSRPGHFKLQHEVVQKILLEGDTLAFILENGVGNRVGEPEEFFPHTFKQLQILQEQLDKIEGSEREQVVGDWARLIAALINVTIRSEPLLDLDERATAARQMTGLLGLLAQRVAEIAPKTLVSVSRTLANALYSERYVSLLRIAELRKIDAQLLTNGQAPIVPLLMERTMLMLRDEDLPAAATLDEFCAQIQSLAQAGASTESLKNLVLRLLPAANEERGLEVLKLQALQKLIFTKNENLSLLGRAELASVFPKGDLNAYAVQLGQRLLDARPGLPADYLISDVSRPLTFLLAAKAKNQGWAYTVVKRWFDAMVPYEGRTSHIYQPVTILHIATLVCAEEYALELTEVYAGHVAAKVKKDPSLAPSVVQDIETYLLREEKLPPRVRARLAVLRGSLIQAPARRAVRKGGRNAASHP